MRVEFTNGATVHQCWTDLPDGTLMAAFQYFDQAKKFAELQIDRECDGNSLVVVDHGTGELMRYTKASVCDDCDGSGFIHPDGVTAESCPSCGACAK